MESGTPPPNLRVLVVDDEDDIRKMLVTFLRKRGWTVDEEDRITSARARMAETHYDILLLDQYLPDGTGLELAAEAVTEDTEAVIMTAYASLASAIEAVRTSIADYLTKPFPSMHFVHASLLRVAETLVLRRHNKELIADLRAQTQVLEGLVVRDPLTGLFNHAFFQEALERELMRSTRYDLELSLVAINIDQFEMINEEHGHRRGDELLAQFAQILVGQFRASDVPFRVRKGDMVARFGGDEFALILPHTPKRGAIAKAEALRQAIAGATFSGLNLGEVTISSGVAAFPQDADNRADLIKSAWSALEAAKQSGRNRITPASPSLNIKVDKTVLNAESVGRRTALDEMIDKASFSYHFQPIMHAGAGGLYGYEVLVRPDHPAIGNPLELFGTAEDAGRITELGRVVRRGALACVAGLSFPYSLFVNLHPYELNDPELLEVDEAVDAQRARIVFEITEGSAIRDFKRVSRRIDELRERGYRIAIDDLGAGYAGLLALSRLTPDFVKLDRALVQRVSEDARTERLVRHIVEFANGEGIGVVAEGIETEAERDILQELGCGLLQGYFVGRPAADWGSYAAATSA